MEKKGSLLIQEIILENFMSYEYARIPLKPGLNIICGPNGSGKSAILLAISVALGQAYTERGRRLSDLIRWGKDTARVTLSFDNTKKDGERPLPKFDTDTFRLSRYLKKDGTYWFEANFHTITKAEVTRLLSEFGIDPDNMLIIMHQHMMEEFGIVTPQQKLKMVEEAVGLGEYRERVIEAQEKLNRILSEEESIASLLENAEQTLAYWKGEYDRYLRRKELLQRRDLLERELAWARLIRQERLVQAWRERIRTKEDELSRIVKGIKGCIADINALKEELNNLRFDQRGLFYSLLELEKQKAEAEATA
ncbi:MAG: AAA family ATPase, partial [Candidatus Bathyarchaeia archaeon]